MTSIRGKFACTMTEKNFMFYCDAAGLESLRRAGIIVRSANPRGSKDNPEGGMIDRIGVGFMRLGKEEAEADTSQPRLRLVPPLNEKAVRSFSMQRRLEDTNSSYEYWGSTSVLDVGTHGGHQFTAGLFRLMRRIWKQQPVELIFREGVEPPQAMVSMPPKFVSIATAEIKRVAGTLASAKGGEKLEQLAESLSAGPSPAPPTAEPPAEAPRAAEEPDEATFGFTQVSLLGLRFSLPVTEVLRTAEKWTRAGFIERKEARMQ